MFKGCSGLTELDLSKFDLSREKIIISDLFSDCSSLTTIYSPTNVICNAELPTTDDDIWYLSDGTVVTALPQNLSYSVAIGKNDVPTEKKELTSKNTTVKLSAASFTYDGKGKEPTVTVKDSNSKEIDTKYYTVTYTNNKKVGKATVTITFKGKYTGTITKTFKINPKATSLKKVASAKTKTVTVSWKKQATQTTGYEIQYATNSKFTKDKKTVTVEGAKTTSKTISKLSSKKNYYVRIRTYKTIDGKKYYSAWSEAQSVKTK
jgi:surface protein